MKIIKNICIVLIIIMTLNFFLNIVYASENTKEIINTFRGTETSTGGGVEEASKLIGRVISIVQVFGIFIAVAMCIGLGIKYMYSSPGDRAQIKNHLTVYVIGAIVMFSATGILQIVKVFYTSITVS